MSRVFPKDDGDACNALFSAGGLCESRLSVCLNISGRFLGISFAVYAAVRKWLRDVACLPIVEVSHILVGLSMSPPQSA